MLAGAHPWSTPPAQGAADCAVPVWFGTVAERLALTLLNLAEKFEAEAGLFIRITPSVSLEELAALAGSPPRAAALILESWLAEGLIAARRQRFILHAPEQLQRLALGEPNQS